MDVWVGGVIAAGHFLSPSCMQWCMYVCMNHGSLLYLVLLVCLDSEYVIDIFCLLLPLARVGVGVGIEAVCRNWVVRGNRYVRLGCENRSDDYLVPVTANIEDILV